MVYGLKSPVFKWLTLSRDQTIWKPDKIVFEKFNVQILGIQVVSVVADQTVLGYKLKRIYVHISMDKVSICGSPDSSFDAHETVLLGPL